MNRQLPLGVRLTPEINFDTYIAGANQEAVKGLCKIAAGGTEQFIFLWGPHGVGKTHLLLATCELADASGKASGYLPLHEIATLQPDIMQDWERLDLVCLDNISAVCANATWEESLFNLFNRLREAGKKLVVTADAPARVLAFKLQDLASRMAWGPNYRLRGLNDDDRLRFLMASAEQRGLRLDPMTGLYVLRRCPRDTHYLQRLLDHLDEYSMAAQRPLTIPMVREALSAFRDITVANQS